jgi:hypothetical protein
MARIICLANSYKHKGRCVAGINIDTGEWVRPLSRKTSAIYNERFIDGIIDNEPNLLDLVEIPIGEQAPDYGCQPENKYLNGGTWGRIRQLSTCDINQYIDNSLNLLHNQDNKVDPDIFTRMPRNNWKSLQLICVTNPNFGLNPWRKKRCIFRYSGIMYELKVTDPAIISKIGNGQAISQDCLFTISMATPYKSPSYEEPYCWKMVAGVVEL